MKKIIRWQITLGRLILEIDQFTLIHNLIKSPGMRDWISVNKPMKTDNFIEIENRDDYEDVDLKTYQWLIGKLMYISYDTWLDTAFVVKQLNKPNIDPKVRYLKTAKKVIRYLKGILHLELTFGAHPKPEEKEKSKIKKPARQSTLDLIDYTNSNYTGDSDNKKLMIRHSFFIYWAIISWFSKK